MLNKNIVLDIIMDFVEQFPGVSLDTAFGQVELADFIADSYLEPADACHVLRNYIGQVAYATNGMDPDLSGLRRAEEYLRSV